MFKNRTIRLLVVVNLLVFGVLSIVNIRSILRNRYRQNLGKMSAKEYVDAIAKEDDQKGTISYADSTRMYSIKAEMTDTDVLWLLSLMDKTFPNGRPYEVTQEFLVDMKILHSKPMTQKQKDIIFGKCSQVLSDQARGTHLQNQSAIETCCHFFDHTKDERAVPFLTPLLSSPSGRIKVVAARTLTRLGHPTKVNIPNGGYGKQKKQ